MTRPRAHWLQHVPFEGLGAIGPWLDAAGYETTRTSLWESTAFPDPASLDLLIAMGGPMSVNDEETHRWLAAEKRFIGAAIRAGTPVLGICLGAQLIAAAMGARVQRAPEREIGWFPVRAEEVAPEASAFRLPPVTDAFHWHGETFDLPAGAVRLASSAACRNQAFQLGRSVIGLQFHPEVTPAAVSALIEHCGADLAPARYVQDEASMRAATPETYQALNTLLAEVLGYLQGAGRIPGG